MQRTTLWIQDGTKNLIIVMFCIDLNVWGKQILSLSYNTSCSKKDLDFTNSILKENYQRKGRNTTTNSREM